MLSCKAALSSYTGARSVPLFCILFWFYFGRQQGHEGNV